MALTSSIFVTPETPLRIFDHQPDGVDYRVVGIEVDGALTIHLGPSWSGDDAIVSTVDHLIESLDEVRSAARVRISLREFGHGPGVPVDSAKYRADMADAGLSAKVAS